MSLTRLLGDQNRRLEGLIALLESELETLAAGTLDGQRLARLAADKQSLLSELERHETLRRQVQRRLGYAEDSDGCRRAARDAGCLATWQATRDLTERADRLNDLAGELVSLRLSHNQRLLDVIHRLAEKTLYGPRGLAGGQPGRLTASA